VFQKARNCDVLLEKISMPKEPHSSLSTELKATSSVLVSDGDASNKEPFSRSHIEQNYIVITDENGVTTHWQESNCEGEFRAST
jgi:hypothetical protein